MSRSPVTSSSRGSCWARPWRGAPARRARRCGATNSPARWGCGPGASWGGSSPSSRRRPSRARSPRASRRSSGPGSWWRRARRAPRHTRLPAVVVSDPDCIFCKIVAGELPGQIVEQDERTVAFMDISPATRGHLLVAPRAHARNLLEISPDDLAATVATAQRLARRVSERLGPDGVNLINSCGSAAWQTVFHFHVHVIPRYEGDPLRLPWRPESGDEEEIARAAADLRGDA